MVGKGLQGLQSADKATETILTPWEASERFTWSPHCTGSVLSCCLPLHVARWSSVSKLVWWRAETPTRELKGTAEEMGLWAVLAVVWHSALCVASGGRSKWFRE